MPIRTYEPGDEEVQARIYNTAAGPLPAFKPANPEEIARRYRMSDADPSSRFYAAEGDKVVGYAVFNPNGRISYPWCLPEAEAQREPLLDAVLAAMTARGLDTAWAAYRGDWTPVLSFLEAHGFAPIRTMVNYVAELDRLPRTPVPAGHSIEPVSRRDLPKVLTLGREVFLDEQAEELETFFWSNPFLDASGLFALKAADGAIRGAGLVVANQAYADPTKIDSSMPCFRLGAFGTERERHKRVNGMFSCAFEDEAAGDALLAEAARRLSHAGLTHVAAQAPSDVPGLLEFYDRHFRRQGSFPILSRNLKR